MSKAIERQPQFALKPLALAIALAAGNIATAAPVGQGMVPSIAGVGTNKNVAAFGQVTLTSPNASTLNVNQATAKAIIDWKKFNIDAGNTVNFKQLDANSVALNRIHQADASKIAGALNANGRVYLVNQNGIIFSGTAKINTGSLLASSLDIDQELFEKSSIYAAIRDGKPALESKKTGGDPGNITIENGAQIKTASGGSVLIFAPNITNEGKIETPDGQTLLAAAKDKVYLMVSDRDDDYRGLIVEVGIGGQVTNARLGEIIAERGNVTLLGMAVNQNGRIKATTAVDLNGTVRLLARDGAVATTEDLTRAAQRGFENAGDVTENPSSDKDGYAYATQTGTVTLGEGSRIDITPDTNGKTAPDLQAQNASKVEIMGKTVVMEKNSRIVAPSGEVIVTATSHPDLAYQSSKDADLIEAADDARIFVDENSLIDVSGVDTELDMSRNVLEVELRGNELKDSPLQRNGILRGKKVKIDLRKGDSIDIADISAAVAAIQRDVNERMTKGGSIKLNSTGDVVQKKGATFDVSGGSIHYRAGYVESTKLLSDGIVYDISDADPNRQYDGILGENTRYYAKWNITETYTGMNTQKHGEWAEAYTAGEAAGSVGIDSHTLLLEGTIRADVIDGFYQRDLGDKAAGGLLDIALRRGIDGAQEVRIVDDMIYHDVAQGDQIVGIIDETDNDSASNEQAPASKTVLIDDDGDGVGDMLLSDEMLSNSGLGTITVRSARGVTVEKNADVNLRDGANLSLLGSEVTHEGTITAHGGKINLTTKKDLNAIDGLHYDVTLAEGSRLDVSGRFTNDYVLGPDGIPTETIAKNAGAVAINARGDLTLEQGSVIDADGGAFVTQKGALKAGKGGDISLTSAVEGGADLVLDGELSSYAFEQGGTLSLEAASVDIGNEADTTSVSSGHVLHLDNDFFTQGGFSAYKVTANLESMHVDNSAQLQLTAKNYSVNDTRYINQASSTDIANFAPVDVLPAWQQQPVSISLALKQSQRPLDASTGDIGTALPGTFIVENGASIVTHVGGSIALSSDNSLYIDGSLRADGGNITATITPHTDNQRGYDATQSLWLGKNAQLISNAAWVEGQQNPDGLRTGTMHDAGTIRLDAQRGFITIEKRDAGASIDVSGASETYDALVTNGKAASVQQMTAEGAAGTIELLAIEGLLLDGDIKATRASASARGANLLISTNADARRYGSIDQDVYKLEFPQNTPVIRVDGARDADLVAGLAFGDALTQDDTRHGVMALDADALNALGLDTLTLDARTREQAKNGGGSFYANSRIEFANAAALDTTRELNLVSNNLRVDDDTLVTLQSAVISAGVDDALYATQQSIRDDLATHPVALTTGKGALVMRGDLIDVVGDVGVDHVAELSLVSAGDIRLRSNPALDRGGLIANGLTANADINLLAQQVYPTTLSDYTIASTREGGRITVARTEGDAPVPLSAAGRLTLLADEIEQGGVVRAPLGEIILGDENTEQLSLLPGSLTSVSAEGLLIPLGRIQGEDLVWNYQAFAAGQNPNPIFIDRTTLPQKNVALQGRAVDLQQGAVIDLSGSGDIYATEFVPGPGGSVDVLDGINAGDSFAIIPARGTAYAPYDTLEKQGTDIAVGQTLQLAQDVTLADGTRLAAGEYTILPARYALQANAVLVTPVDVKGNVAPGTAMSRIDGTPVAVGKYAVANTSAQDANWSAFAFEPGSIALTRSEYVRKTATEFFTGDNALFSMPGDAAHMAIVAGNALNLDATLVATHAETGEGARVDIAADHLVVTRSGDTTQWGDDTVAISADDINAFGADSVLLGGVRAGATVEVDDENDAIVTRIDVRSADVSVQEGATLSGKEFVLAASGSVNVGSNAKIVASGTDDNTTKQIVVDGDGALLQASGLHGASVMRENETGATGDLALADSALLQASSSVVLDASRNMVIDNSRIDADRIAVSSSRISLGDAADATAVSGTLLDSNLLATLLQRNPNQLTLASRSDLDVLSDVALHANNLTLQAGNINANGHAAQFNADSMLVLEGNASNTDAVDAGGTLAFSAAYVQLGDDSQAVVANANLLLDADTVAINAGNGVLLRDALTLETSGDVNLAAPHITAADAAQITVQADGDIHATKAGTDNPLLLALSAIGASLQLTGNSVMLDTQVKLPSARVNVTAAQGDIALDAQANVDVSGVTQTFGDKQVASGGGSVRLQSDAGDIALAQGSVINVSGAALTDSKGIARDGSDAGSIVLNASTGAVRLGGDIKGNAFNAGEGGSVGIDAVDVGDNAALFSALQRGGFDNTVAIRQREGDLVVAAQDTIKAHEVHLIADSGDITVAGTLDASGEKGGKVALDAGQDAVLTASARIDAHATAAEGRGGEVSIASIDGDLDLQQGATIDVSGGDDSADNQNINSVRQGEVHLRARRNADHSINVKELNASITGAERIELEAFDDSISADVIDADVWQAIDDNIGEFVAFLNDNYADFLAHGSLAALDNFHVLPGVEVRSSGDMTVSSGDRIDEFTVDTAKDFADERYVIGGKSEAGVLTLRAGGNLDIDASISDGFVADAVSDAVYNNVFWYFSTTKVLSADQSWSYNFIAGADFASAYRGSAQQGVGDVTLAQDVVVRTGTGDILVAAGNDVVFKTATSALYTAGRSDLYQYQTPAYLLTPDNAFLGMADSYEMPYIGYIHPYELTGFFEGGALPQHLAFGRDGGDIRIEAGHDVVMEEATQQLSSDWLQRISGDIVSGLDLQSLIAANFSAVVVDDFHNGIATLGGGDISVEAGRNITNLAASAPVTVRQNRRADMNNADNPLPITGKIIASDDTYLWERNGGGDVSLNAGGDILSPQLLADSGSLTLNAAGNIGAAADGNAAMLAVTDTRVSIDAFRNVDIDAIYNTSIVPQSALQYVNLAHYSLYFSYADDARVDIRSTAGDVTFDNSLDLTVGSSNTPRYVNTDIIGDELFKVFPGSLYATSLSGDIRLENDLVLFPSSQGQLELLAKRDITTSSNENILRLVISDADNSGIGDKSLPTLLNAVQFESVQAATATALYQSFFDYGTLLNDENATLPNLPEKHAATPVHQGDLTAALMVAATGNIDGNRNLIITSAKQLRAYASNDIRDISFDLQNANASDTSELRAGNDIDLGYNLNPAFGKISQNDLGIQIAGPGRLDVIAGDDLILGSSNGIVSLGNQLNPALPETGADVMAMAGAASLDTARVALAYLHHTGAESGSRLIDLAKADSDLLLAILKNPQAYGLSLSLDSTPASRDDAQVAFQGLSTSQQWQVALAVLNTGKSHVDDRDYTAALVSFVLSDRFAGDAVAMASSLTGQSFDTREQLIDFFASQSSAQNNTLANAMLSQLDNIDQRGLLFDVVYDEVRKGGIESLSGVVNDPATQGFQRGYNAIEALFPDIDQNDAALASNGSDIGMVFSTISTRDGGDVNFMTPQGGINVGLAGKFAGNTKETSELGVLVQSTGDVRGITYDDININASRIFALDGGDILLWSSQHDIDAGRGAKTALSIPPPRTKYNADGSPGGTELPASVSGSGIQAAVYTPGRNAGSVYLFAPQGVIDAGDAGISSAGDLFLAATQVLGADNISFGGVSIGVPTTTGISASLSGVGDSAASSTTSATDQVAENSTSNCSDEDDCEENAGVAFVTVEIIGLGD